MGRLRVLFDQEAEAPKRSGDPVGNQSIRRDGKARVGRKIRCELAEEHRQDRCVGVRHLDGQDIATIIVRQRLARDCPRADSFARGWPERACGDEARRL
jgi:endonuclease YncB( thermonuclease family)